MQNRDEMHPQDKRNLIIFAVLSIAMWLSYDYFIGRPHAEAMRRAAQQAQVRNAAIEQTAAVQIRPVEDVVGETPRVEIKAPALTGSINLRGGRLDDVQLNDYYKTVAKTEHVHVLSPARTPHPRYVETGWTAAGDLAKNIPDANTVWKIKGGEATLTPETPVTLTYTAPNGLVFERTYTVDENFAFSIDNRVVNKTGESVTLYPYALATEHGLPEDFMNLGVIHEGPLGYIGEGLEEFRYKDFKKKPELNFSAANGWIGLTGKYWLTAIAPAKQGEESRFRFVSTNPTGQKDKDRYQVDVTGPAVTVASGAEGNYAINVFSGAKKLKLLESYEQKWGVPHFDLAVDFGWFYFLTKPFFLAINFLYGLTGNFGIAIILFTCVLRIFVFPLANTSYKSFAKMRQVAPEMYDLRHKYKDDKQKLQQELVQLYQRHNVNPAAGCLPIIIQIPIFFALYKVLSNTIEMRHAPFYGWIHDLSAMDPTTIFNLFGLIPWTPPHFLMIGAWPLMMMIAMVVQKNLSPPPEDPIQARIIAIMPFFMTFIMAKFAAGLVIYWTVNNILAIIQQAVIMKRMGVPVHLFTKDKVNKALEKEISDGPTVHPELEVLEHKIEDALEGESKTVSAPKPKKKKKK